MRSLYLYFSLGTVVPSGIKWTAAASISKMNKFKKKEVGKKKKKKVKIPMLSHAREVFLFSLGLDTAS